MEGRLQYAGIFEDSNDLGLMFAVAWSIILFPLVNKTGILGRILLVCWLLPLGWAILLTASRGAILAALTSVLLAFRRRFNIVLPVVLAFGLLIGLNQMGITRMDRLSADEGSAEGRLVSWGQGWYMFRSHLLLGVGPRNFTLYHGKGAHSSLVQAGSEIGVIGLACWIGFFYYPLQEFATFGWVIGKNSKTPFALSQLQAALMACMVAALFLSRVYITTPYLLAGLAIAARDVTGDESVDRPQVTEGLTFVRLSLLTLIALLAWRISAREFITGI
jgi:O-antigen ligase